MYDVPFFNKLKRLMLADYAGIRRIKHIRMCCKWKIIIFDQEHCVDI